MVGQEIEWKLRDWDQSEGVNLGGRAGMIVESRIELVGRRKVWMRLRNQDSIESIQGYFQSS